MNINPINLNLKLVGTKFDNSIGESFSPLNKEKLIN